MKPVTFDSEAEDEFQAAAAYYEGQRAGLGDDFVAEVEQAIQRIAQMPQAFPLHGSSGLRSAFCVVFLTRSFSWNCKIVSGSRPSPINGVVRSTGLIGDLET